jgi:60 kDa SS-A/Ro ribonucleoprotein
LLRLAHPKAPSREHDAVFRWTLKGMDLGERTVTRRVSGEPRPVVYRAAGELPGLVHAFEQAKKAESRAEIVSLITDYHLPREAIPTQWLNEPQVWDALLPRMPMTAMVRNLGKMTALGLVQPFSEAAVFIQRKLCDGTTLKRARIHPMAILIAMKVYAQGRGEKGKLTWKPVSKIVDALDQAFYASFANVEPCRKPVVLALDVSGSMSWAISGSCISAREASAAMALITAATEKDYHIMAFSTQFMPVTVSPRMRLDDVVKAISGLPFMGTDCALPMTWAQENKLNVSAFVTYTDSETWAGRIHPAQAIKAYRNRRVSNAKVVVVGMTSNGFSLADPNDRGMLDVVGFDATAPAVIADFIRS